MTRALRVGLPLIALAAVWSRQGPRPTARTGFDAERALQTLRDVAGEEPRPVGSAAHRRTGAAITEHLEQLGLEPVLQEATSCVPGRCARVHNIAAHVAGPERDRVLLVAHYDSVPAGPGIGDDGSGVAILLEAAALARERTPRNGLAVLFTDAEELGLLGASAFVGAHPWAGDAGAVVNVEARGTGGRSWLFETSSPNGWIASLAAEHLSQPAMSSLAYEIYERLPNDTDLTVFRAAGIPGANFGFIDRVEHYHTPLDDFAHVDPRSVQQQGDHAIGLWQAMGDADLAAVPDGDAVYGDLLGLAVVRWPAAAAVPIAVAVLAWVLALFAYGARRERGSLRSLAAVVLAVPSALALLWGVSVGLHLVLGALGAGYGVPLPFRAGVWAGTAAALAATLPLWQRATVSARWGAVWSWAAAAGLALAVLAPGASYLFVLPAGWAALWWSAGLAARRGPPWAWALVGALVGGVIWLELACQLEVSVLLAAPAIAVPLSVALAFWFPALQAPGRRVAGVLAGAGLVGVASTLVLPAGTPERPERVSFTHVQTERGSVWMASAREAPPGFVEGGPPASVPWSGSWMALAPRRDDAVPTGSWDGRTLTIASRRGAVSLGLGVPRTTGVRVDGHAVEHRGVVLLEGAERWDVELSSTELVSVFDVLPLDELGPGVVRTPAQVPSQWGDRSILFGEVDPP